MFAVVLVGGFGTRLRPLTDDVPKPMLPVLHRPMIVRLVERLEQGGVTDVVLALGFKPEPFQTAFPEGVHGSVRIHYAVEPEPLDTAGAIGFAARAVGVRDTFVVANGDIITGLPIADLVTAHQRLGAEATLHLTPVDDPSAFGVVELGDNGRIGRFVEKPQPGETTSNLVNAGTYVFEPSVLDLIPALTRVSAERVVFPALAARGELAGHETSDDWTDTGRPDEYLQANLDLARVSDNAIHPSATVRPGAVIIDSVVGPDAVVGTGARVVESLLIGEATVAADATVERSVVMGSVGIGSHVADSVIGARHRVVAGSRVTNARLPEPVG